MFLEPMQFDPRLTKALFLPVKNNSQALPQFLRVDVRLARVTRQVHQKLKP